MDNFVDLGRKMSLTGQDDQIKQESCYGKDEEIVYEESKEMMMYVINMKLIIKD